MDPALVLLGKFLQDGRGNAAGRTPVGVEIDDRGKVPLVYPLVLVLL
jgi:hypothetical protein